MATIILKNLVESRLALPVRSQSAVFWRDPVRFLATMMGKDLNSHSPSLSPLSVRFERTQPHGSSESSYRRSYADKQNKTTQDNLTSYVKSQYLAEKLDKLDRSDPDDLSLSSN